MLIKLKLFTVLKFKRRENIVKCKNFFVVGTSNLSEIVAIFREINSKECIRQIGTKVISSIFLVLTKINPDILTSKRITGIITPI